MSVAELKAKGNAAFGKKEFDDAIKHYSDAIAAAKGPEDSVHVLYSNRSACYSGLKQWSKALEDAESTIKASPSFAKGYGRKGAALHGARKLEEALEAYEEGLKIAPEDANLKKGMEDVKKAQDKELSGDALGGGMGKMFQDPMLFQKLSANPKTAPLLADASFMAKLKQLQANPNDAMTAFQDPRMIQVMGVLMGIDLQAFERPEGSDELPTNLESKREEIEKQTKPQGGSTASSAAAASTNGTSNGTSKAAAAAAASSEDTPMKDANKDEDEEEAEQSSSKGDQAAADAEKAKGNALYVKKQVDEAIPHYEKAWELYKDITYLNNLAACYFEKKDYDTCIKTCEKAVEEGRHLRADYKLVAKAFGRIGSAYDKQGDLPKAIANYEKSLTEHRTPEILTKLREAEKALKEKQRKDYIDPAKSEEERNRGNDLYKKGDFVGSVQAYSESIKRNPEDPRGYTNRASAYTKLVALPEGLKDCEEAIKIDPTFTKAYIRKSNVLFIMKEYTKSLDAIHKASEVDKEHHNNASAKEIQAQEYKCYQALATERSGETDEDTLKRAMRDPEVAQIMQDPVMQSILQQAQQDPKALQNHMQNAQVRQKIEKLVAAGIIKTR